MDEDSSTDHVLFNYTPGSDDNDDGDCRYRCSKDNIVNNFGKSLLNLCFVLL